MRSSIATRFAYRSRLAKAMFRCALPLCVVLYESASFAEGPPAISPLSRGWRFDEKGGAALYARVCAACHQPDANGAAGAASYPALAANQNLASAEYTESVLLNGLRGMPAIGRLMSDEQVAEVINYVRSHFGNNYEDALSASDVGAVRPK
jgi:cytochrome c553